MVQGTLLVVDDDKLIRWSLRRRLEQEHFEVIEAATGEEALDQLVRGIDLVLLDYKLPDSKDFELLERMLEQDPDTPVIVLTAFSSVDKAVQAMKLGAHHYVSKPYDPDEIAILVERALELARMRRKIYLLQHESIAGFDSIVGESPPMQACKKLLSRIASSPSSTVLLTGESGTGKDLVAKAIHANSDRASGPFVNITCTALSQTLLESELFGHERGAFTDAKVRKKGLLAHAHGGTVFLDEIGEMDPALQAKLLRVMEDKTFRPVGGAADIRTDVRVIAATNADLKEAVRSRAFREDLFYRLAVLTVKLPPLRDREGDVELLVRFFIEKFRRQFKKEALRVSSGTMRRLSCYPWPGNVRELRNAVERAVLLSDGSCLTERDFEAIFSVGVDPEQLPFDLPPEGVDLRTLERRLLTQALERTGGNRTMAGALLGLNRDQVRYRIDKYNLTSTITPRHSSVH